MKLEWLMDYSAQLSALLNVGAGPQGPRLIAEVAGGEFNGARLRGRIRPAAAADWLTMGDGYGHLDVRATFETDDGAYIYVQYFGCIEMTPAVQAALGGKGGTEFGDAYFFTAPRFQTGDPRYAWLNNIVCVGQGRAIEGGVEYKVYQVTND